jgi:hypothetical protein
MSLQLEVGKSYKARNGEIFKVIRDDSSRDKWLITKKYGTNAHYSHFLNGKYFCASLSNHQFDLIEEVKEESTSPKQKESAMSLKLELNKKYVTRNGSIFQVVGFENTRADSVITSELGKSTSRYYHYRDGSYNLHYESAYDLLQEYIEEVIPTLSPEKILKSYFKYNGDIVKVKSIITSLDKEGNAFTKYVFFVGITDIEWIGDINSLEMIEVEELKIKNRSVFEYGSTMFVYIEGILYRMGIDCDLIKLKTQGNNIWRINDKMLKIIVEIVE